MNLEETEHKKQNIKKTSEKSLNDFENLFNESPIAFWLEDLSEIKKDLNKLVDKGIIDFKKYFDENPNFMVECASKIKVLDINKAAIKLHQAKDKNFLLKNISKTFNENSIEIFKEELAAFVKNETKFSASSKLLTFDGNVIDVYMNAFALENHEHDLSKVIISFTDISEKVKNSSQIIKLNKQLLEERNIFVKGNVVVFKWLNDKNWTIDYVSPNVENVFEYDKNDFFTKKIKYSDIIHKDDIERVQLEVEKAKNNKLDNFEHQPYRIIKKDNKIVWLYDFSSIVRNENNEISHFLGYVKDITKDKLLEQEKEDLFAEINNQFNEYSTLNQLYEKINNELEIKNEKLAKSQEKYKKLSNLTFEGILIHKKGIALEVNKSFADMFGYKQEELIGKNVINLLVPNKYHPLIEEYTKLNHALPYEVKGIKKDGTIFPIELESKVLQDQEKNVRVTAVRNISKIKKIKKDKKTSENHLLTLINAMEDIVCFKDGEGKWLIANDADLKLFNLENVDYKGKKDSDLAHYSDFYKEAFLTCETSDELAWKNKDKSKGIEVIPTPEGKDKIFDITKIPLFYSSGNRKGLVVHGRDITLQKAAEQALIESETSFRTLFENSPLGIFTASPNGQILDANQALIEILGSPSIEATKQINLLNFPSLIKNGFADDFKNVVETGIILKKEYYYTANWGKTANLWEHIVPLKDDLGKVNKIYTIIENTTERKIIENELFRQKNLFETMFNSISDAVIITDNERKIILFNKASLKLFKYTAKEITGNKTEIFYEKTDLYNKKGEEVFDINSEKNSDIFIVNYKDKKGRVFKGETFGTKLFNENKEWIGNLGVIRDVSERINMLEELNRAKDKAEESNQLKTAFLNNLSHEIRTPMNSIMGFSQLLNKKSLSETKRTSFTEKITNSSKQLLSIVEDIINISKIES
ncbi:MAG: PAS domain S-box protein, partial [Bacteroidales bacterium]|nr:PAS domain S-box protein [Bacteroidales bacterium]